VQFISRITNFPRARYGDPDGGTSRRKKAYMLVAEIDDFVEFVAREVHTGGMVWEIDHEEFGAVLGEEVRVERSHVQDQESEERGHWRF